MTAVDEAAEALAPDVDPRIETLAKLREPFPPEQIGKLSRYSGPKTTPKDQRTKSDCGVCGKYHETPAVHLDYVGHAAVTDRLLRLDPLWTWEPVAFDEKGAPLVQRGEGRAVMWIKLTIAGMTRFGVGIAPAGKDEVEKELISDAIRNAAMRFGVALDLWSKEDLHGDGESESKRSPTPPPPDEGPVTWPANEVIGALRDRIANELDDDGRVDFRSWVTDQSFGHDWPKLPVRVVAAWNAELDRRRCAAESCAECGSARTNRVIHDGRVVCADRNGCADRIKKRDEPKPAPADPAVVEQALASGATTVGDLRVRPDENGFDGTEPF